MRAYLFVLLAACAPEIAPGAYICGEERSCPEELVCDGVSNICELATNARPFACGETDEAEPNNSFAEAQQLGVLGCVSQLAETIACHGADGSTEDWYRFSIGACSSSNARARVTFSIAYEPLVVELLDASGAVRATGTPCFDNDEDDGVATYCIDQPITGNAEYGFRVSGRGADDCAGECAFNRYTITMQTYTP